MRFCFYPYLAFFSFGNLYFLEFMKQDLINYDKDPNKVIECGILFEDSLDCSTWLVFETIVRTLFLLFTIQ